MKRYRLNALLLGVITLMGCMPAVAPIPTSTPFSPVATPCEQICVVPSLSSPSPAPSVLPWYPSPTSAPPCDPRLDEYCLEEAFFWFRWPLPKYSVDASYRYGSTQAGARVPHHGVEMPAASGTPVLAAADGVVYYAGADSISLFSPWPNFYGNLVVLEHEFEEKPYPHLYTLYAHLSRLEVEKGQWVYAGEPIGQVGSSGAAIGSHLHFEVRLEAQTYNSSLNPELYLHPEAGHGALALRLRDQAGNRVAGILNFQRYHETGEILAAFQVETYATETFNPESYWREDVGLGNMPAGKYRITFLFKGRLYEKWIEIQAGRLTLAQLTLQ